MKKIYLVIAGAFLIFLVIVSMLLSLSNKPTTNTQKGLLSPTTVPLDSSRIINQPTGTPIGQTTGGDQGLKDLDNLSKLSIIPTFETEDFKAQYNVNLNQIVVEKKTLQAETKFTEWADKNNYSLLVNNPNTVKFIRPGQNPEFDPLIGFLNIFMNMGQGSESPSSTLQSPNLPPTTYPLQPTTSFAYFPQCGDLGDLQLPSGCNLCVAGCGPTAVAMIASSYLGPQYDPQSVVNLYRSRGFLLGCEGSRYSDAKQILQSLGLKTTDYLIFNSEKSDTVVPDLKKYLSAGWTFFTLASFCDGGCGHYFWITDIDAQGNVWAYDPAYGRYEIPYNENSRYPYPLYRLAFGVKR